MAKQEVIKNVYEGGTPDVYDRKYLKYLPALPQDRTINNVLDALRTHDLPTIEKALTPIANVSNNFMFILGMACHIIEQEQLYMSSEYGWSYLRYAEQRLTGELNIPIATISEAKITMEVYKNHFNQLKKAGFTIEKNASKLRYLPEALENHNEGEVYEKIVDSSFREFRDWAQQKKIARNHKPGKDTRVDAVIKGNQLIINGKNILNFPKGLSKDIKELIKSDLQDTFSIREGGNLPFIISTYSKGEQADVERFLKKIRAKK
jgi:hypothetical protein